MTVDLLQPGGLLGRYRLVREVGRGSLGLVFLAQDTLSNESLCVKVLHPAIAARPEVIERCQRAIQLTGHLRGTGRRP